MKLIFEKKFRLKDTLQYAKKSGDKNKIHIKNDVQKYSNFKRPIVHGCLVVENVYSKIKNLNQFKSNSIENIQIFFKEPIFIRENISIYISEAKKQVIKLIGYSGMTEKILIFIELKKNNKKEDYLTKNISEKEFITKLMQISKSVGNFKKRINIISQIDISYTSRNSKSKKVQEINSSLHKLTISGKNLYTVTRFFSFPSKYSEKKIYYNSELHNKKLFSNSKKILIIGGSSGLGKVLTEFYAKKKLDVTFTFNKNHQIAKRIYQKNNNLKYFKFNKEILKKKKIKDKIKNFNYIYFFPTPKIFQVSEDFFNYYNLKEFIDVYSLFLRDIINCLSRNIKYKIYVPSSEIINTKSTKFFDYRMGKIIQENLCQFVNLKSKNIKIFNPRLGIHYTKETFHIMNNNSNYNYFLNSATKILEK